MSKGSVVLSGKTRDRKTLKIRKGESVVVMNTVYKTKVLGKKLVFSRHSLERVVGRDILQTEVAESIYKGRMYYEGHGTFVVSHDVYKIIVTESTKEFKVVSVMYHEDFNRAVSLYKKRYHVPYEEAVLDLKKVACGKFHGGSNKRLVGMSLSQLAKLAYNYKRGVCDRDGNDVVSVSTRRRRSKIKVS